ncbi:hypothetical protein RDI58_017721 [Solanum bulbocastanum]|uniref:Uncharacterized protein n=1 Tax=Solanum bulbocastanum TaxID=147425 RepID=A0AAN8TFZ1_SOLBU
MENEQWMRDFYANLKETDMLIRLITIRGKVINYGSKVINAIYGLLDHDIRPSRIRLLKMLKEKETLPILRPEEQRDEPNAWNDDGGAEDIEAINTNGDD